MPALEIAIGPEGGWAPEEEALFDANGWRAVSLGPRILRAETAAIAALAVVASMSGMRSIAFPGLKIETWRHPQYPLDAVRLTARRRASTE